MATNISFQYHFNEGSLVRVDVMKNGNFFKCIGVDPDEYLAMHNQDFEETLKYLIRNDVKVRVGVLREDQTAEIFDEAYHIKLPKEDLEDRKYKDDREKYYSDKNNYFNLWIQEDPVEVNDRKGNWKGYGWIIVELPKEIEGIKYVPVIVHRTGGINIHPYFHKYFLRSFTKEERHRILGFIYVYGSRMLGYVNTDYVQSVKKDKSEPIRPIINLRLSNDIWYYDNDEAPKRINLGGPRNSDNFFYQFDKDNYESWLNKTKDAFEGQ